MSKLKTVLAAVDAYNMKDPIGFSIAGKSQPQEYFLSLKVTEWVRYLAPAADEELLIAARAHHIGRWEIPREKYPEGKAGYLNWRNELALFHAEKTAEIMQEADYSPAAQERVKALIMKKQLKKDPEVQVLENALCLVFLQYQYEDFRLKHPEEKVVHILKKSLRKMDDRGKEEALKLDYSEQGLACLRKALE